MECGYLLVGERTGIFLKKIKKKETVPSNSLLFLHLVMQDVSYYRNNG